MRLARQRLRQIIKEAQASANDLDARAEGQPGTQGERLETRRLVHKYTTDLRTLQGKHYFDDMVPQERQAELEAHLDAALQGLAELKNMFDEEIRAQSPGLQEKKMKITKSKLRKIIKEEARRALQEDGANPAVEFDEIMREMEAAGMQEWTARLESWFEDVRYDLPDPAGDAYNKYKRHAQGRD